MDNTELTIFKRFCSLKRSGIEFEYSREQRPSKEGKEAPALISKCLSRDSDCNNLNCLFANGSKDPFFDVDHPIHSGFLVHWTGKDIDDKYDPNWEQTNEPILRQDIITPYIDRLKNVLEYGLWMTTSDNDQPQYYQNKKIKRSPFYRTCFSELKLSEARVHAKKFGRLGIGVKRPFVMHRRGSPMVYYREEFGNWFFEPFLTEQDSDEIQIPSDAWWSYFLKSMNEGKTNKGFMKYKNFDESEWRIIHSPEIEEILGLPEGIKKAPEEDRKFVEYLKRNNVPDSMRPKYLLPLDKWLAFIIYPSLAIKVFAEQDDSLWSLMKEKNIKTKTPEVIEPNTHSAQYEQYSRPFGIDLDACRNF